MSFQARVGTWIAAHLVGDVPVGERFGLSGNPRPLELQFETGVGLDDIVLRLSDGGEIFIQCKTQAGLTRHPSSALAKTIAQLVRLYVAHSRESKRLDPTRSTAVLAITEDASRSLNVLERACRSFDHGESWASVHKRGSNKQREALNVFAAHARLAWTKIASRPPKARDLVELARLFRIIRFDLTPGARDWREASRVIGTNLFGREDAGSKAITTLLDIVRGLIQSGASIRCDGLLGALRNAGFEDTRTPRYDEDVRRLRQVTELECDRLRRHSVLPLAGGISIQRECLAPLASAVDDGSVLVVGEPGAGKTGVLVALVEQRLAKIGPIVFLSVERLAGATTLDDLRAELRLDHPLIEVLAAWPGKHPGVLVIDALDASRGEPSEGVFASLIEEAVAQLGERWSIVASIRIFDLTNGRRFRQIMSGTPPDPAFALKDLNQVSHFLVRRLTEGELNEVAQSNQTLGSLVETAPTSLRGLLSNVFNLSLAAKLIDGDVAVDNIHKIATQSDLIDLYEDIRLPSNRLKVAAASAVAKMVERRSLSVLAVSVDHEAIDDVLQSGVMTKAGDRIAFAHHVLFDHVAGRFFLQWDDPDKLVAQINATQSIGTLLGPSLRFAMDRIWREDRLGKPQTWRLIAAIAASTRADPVVASVALRTGAESVADPKDVEALIEMLGARRNADVTGRILSRLARFVSTGIAESGSIASSKAIAWATVASHAVRVGIPQFADGARILLLALFEKSEFTDAAFAVAFGRAARELLAFAWTQDLGSPVYATSAIRYVAKTFATDPSASRVLLERILEEPRFSQHAHEEAPWLAAGVRSIFPTDPAFAARIYAVLFGPPAPDDRKTFLGGPSRIMGLMSTRKQDYGHARWHLTQSLKSFLEANPEFGTRAVIGANGALANGDNLTHRTLKHVQIPLGGRTIIVIEDHSSFEDWRDRDGRAHSPEDDILSVFVRYIRSCPTESFRTSIETALGAESSTSIWSRLLGVGVERPGIVDDLLWPLVICPEFMGFQGVSVEAIHYVSSTYASRSLDDRRTFESRLFAPRSPEGDSDQKWWRSIAARFLSTVQPNLLATDEMRTLRQELEEAERLVGNRPLVSMEFGFGPADRIADHILESSGVNLEHPPDRDIRIVARALEEVLKNADKKPSLVEIRQLWTALSAIVCAIDVAVDPKPHIETLRASWGAVSNAVERIAQSKAYDPNSETEPTLDAMLAMIERLLQSPFPEAPSADSTDADDDDRLMSWGNWDVRVYAASSLVHLAPRIAASQPKILDHLRTLLRDPVATVRLQVAQSLNVLWDLARESMWGMVESVAQYETSRSVLGFFVGGPLLKLAGPEPRRVELLVRAILDRLAASRRVESGNSRGTFEEAVGGIAAQLWVGRAQEGVRGWVANWTSDLASGERYLWHMISALRGALFLSYNEKTTNDGTSIQVRAREVLESVVAGAGEAIRNSEQILQGPDEPESARQSAERIYVAGERLIDHSCNQLYFGSGAFETKEGDKPGLLTNESMRLFLDEYSLLLNRIAEFGSAHTIHYLIELYAYVASAAPAVIFDRVADLLVGPAVRARYQLESLAADLLVSLVRRYLADYRGIFEDSARRERLIEVLGLFSNAGWPDAQKLLYELPDLLR